ncbi:uncharacterized protein PG998_015123 [Apiospora kogelbergensis]|uniref:uncharacterized protein n=1 Tax=Apiospora kogelbergensis TaxID=1337665 RepID=UPI00313225BE
MQLTNLFVSALLAMSVSAADDNKGDGNKGDHKGGNSIGKQCFQMAKLEMITKFGANDTAVAAKFHNNQTAIDDFKKKVAASDTKLKAMSANATLVSECATINAEAREKGECGKMKFAEKMLAMAGNDTALQTKFKNNQTKIDAFKAKAEGAKADLAAMQGNATLTSFCSVQTTKHECRKMAMLQKQTDMAKNQTALEAKFKGDEAKVKAFQDKSAKWETELKAMMGNSTLMDTCKTLNQAQAQNTNNAAAKDGKKSAAQTLEAFSGLITAAFAVAVAGTLML